MSTIPLGDTSAADLVAAAYADINLTELPDPILTWWTSSVSVHHPGKRYHSSQWCARLEKIRNKLTAEHAFSEIGPKVCYECLPGPRDGDTPRRLGHATLNAARLNIELRIVAAMLDEGDERESVLRKLSELEHHVRRNADGDTRHQAAAAAAVDAYNRLRLRVTATGRDDAVLRRYAEAMLVARDTDQPASALDLQLLGGYQTSPGRGGSTAATLKAGWQPFLKVLAGGGTLADARAAAAAAILPLRTPFRLDMLPKSIPVPAGLTEVTLDWLVAQWRDAATALAGKVLDEWVDQVEQVGAAYAGLGQLTVTLQYRGGTVGGLPWILTEALKPFTAAYPYQVRPGEAAQWAVTAPVSVAVWLMREAKANAVDVTLEPAGDNTAEVLAAAGELQAANPRMTFADALAAARGNAYAPAAA